MRGAAGKTPGHRAAVERLRKTMRWSEGGDGFVHAGLLQAATGLRAVGMGVLVVLRPELWRGPAQPHENRRHRVQPPGAALRRRHGGNGSLQRFPLQGEAGLRALRLGKLERVHQDLRGRAEEPHPQRGHRRARGREAVRGRAGGDRGVWNGHLRHGHRLQLARVAGVERLQPQLRGGVAGPVAHDRAGAPGPGQAVRAAGHGGGGHVRPGPVPRGEGLRLRTLDALGRLQRHLPRGEAARAARRAVPEARRRGVRGRVKGDGGLQQRQL
mmetsp:Transcript_3655/g.8744  ORF Transcript_3655/g.8744 Transcript_3655/m.8744 type:complete len:270 (+) Transcript_3655:392-1201(+)